MIGKAFDMPAEVGIISTAEVVVEIGELLPEANAVREECNLARERSR